MKVVITGKPDVGKTTITHIIKCEFAKEVVIGSDAIERMKAISIPNPKSLYSRKCYQRALYHMQVELENIMTDRHPDKLILCDHGTLDCLTLWPDSPESFYKDVNSSLEKELARYDWVIQINGSSSKSDSPLPTTPPLSSQDFWCRHPQFLTVPAKKGFSFCYIEIAKIIKDILAGVPYEKIRAHLTHSVEKTEKVELSQIIQ